MFDINNLTYIDNIKCKLFYKNNYYDVKLNVENGNYSILSSFNITPSAIAALFALE